MLILCLSYFTTTVSCKTDLVWLSFYTVPCTLWILPNTIMPYLLFNGSSSSWLPFSQKIVNLSLAVRSLSLSLYTWGFSCAQQVRALVLIEAKTHFKAIWHAVVSSEHNNTNHSKQTPLLVSDERYAIAKDAICSQFTLVVSHTVILEYFNIKE